jgi:hypothetical protein
MTRTAVGVDRLVTLLLGLGFIAAAVALVGWEQHRIGAGRAVSVPVDTWTAAGWWPWAAGGAGVVLVVVGLRWLAAHRPAPRLHRIPVSDAESSVDAVAVASAAADELAADPAVTKARGTAVLERGRRVVTLTVTTPARHGIAPAVRAADEAARATTRMLGDAVAVRTVVHADAKGGTVVR